MKAIVVLEEGLSWGGWEARDAQSCMRVSNQGGAGGGPIFQVKQTKQRSRGCSHERVSHFMDWFLWRFMVVVMECGLSSSPPLGKVSRHWSPPHVQALLGMLWRWVGLGEQWTQHLSPANDGRWSTSPQSIWVSGLLRLNTKKVRPWSFHKTTGLGVLVWAPTTHPSRIHVPLSCKPQRAITLRGKGPLRYTP